MLKDGRGLTPSLTATVAVVVAVVSWVALRIWTAQGGTLPDAPWLGVVLLVFMAAGVYGAGLFVRRYLRGEAARPLSPLRAMRTLVLAQAAALTGAVVLGWYAARALALLPNMDVASVQSHMWPVLAYCLAGVLHTVTGLRVQAMCRLPDDEDKDDHRPYVR